MTFLNNLALALIIIGGLNWGLVGLFDYNLVEAIFGLDSWLSNAIYVIVGIAALYSLYLFKPVTTGTHIRHERHTPAPH